MVDHSKDFITKHGIHKLSEYTKRTFVDHQEYSDPEIIQALTLITEIINEIENATDTWDASVTISGIKYGSILHDLIKKLMHPLVELDTGYNGVLSRYYSKPSLQDIVNGICYCLIIFLYEFKLKNDKFDISENLILTLKLIETSRLQTGFTSNSLGDLRDEFHSIGSTFDEQLKNNIQILEEKFENVSSKLIETDTTLKFVPLHNGFDKILKEKRTELRITLTFTLFLGLTVLGLLWRAIDISYINLGSELKIREVVLLAKTTAITIITVYFFRISYLEYKSVKAQILQLELRNTVCQFIKGYGEYTETILKQNQHGLEKFENLIFSNIVADPQQIPSVLDGIEQAAKSIKNIK